MIKPFLLVFITCSLYAMSIEDAWLKVQSANESLKASDDGVGIAQMKKDSASSMYLPSVSFTGSYTHLSEPIKLEDKINLNNLPIPLGTIPFRLDLSKQDVFLANLHMLWPLYTGGKIDAAQDIYSAGLDEAKALKAMKEDALFLKLVKYYYGVVVAKSLYQTRLESQKALQKHYENGQKLRKNGQIAKIELLNAQVQRDNATIETQKAKHKYEIALSALESLTHQKDKPSSPLFVSGDEQDEVYYEKQTQEQSAVLGVLDAKEEQSKALINIKTGAWHPQVVGYANYNLYKDDSIISQTMPQWFAGVMVKIDILKRKDRSQEIQSAKLLHSKVAHLRADALESLALLVEKTYKEMMDAKEEYEALNSTIELSEENYRLRTISFAEGLSTSVELVDAQMLLLGAKTKKLNAAYTYMQKLAQLCVLSGERDQFFTLTKGNE